MSCGCTGLEKDGKAIVDLVRSKEKGTLRMRVEHEIQCSCGNTFIMTTHVDKCPHCNMTYGVTPCSSMNKENILAAGINY
ncbi:hypothetical protein UT300019_25050 [Clostridium sp. CTA-19]